MVLLHLSHDDGPSNRSSVLLLQTTWIQTIAWQHSYKNGRVETGGFRRSAPTGFRAHTFLTWDILGFVHIILFPHGLPLNKNRRVSTSMDFKSHLGLNHFWRVDTCCLCALGYELHHYLLSEANKCLEIYSNVPNPLMPMNLFKDLRGFVCLNVMAACAGGLYVSLSILWPSRK